jgi:hypothetical protein
LRHAAGWPDPAAAQVRCSAAVFMPPCREHM